MRPGPGTHVNRWQQAWAGAAGGQPGVGPGARQLPYSGPRRHAGRATVGAGGENHLCTARRCAVYENGFAGVEPPLPLLSRTGELPLEAFAEQITRCGYRGPRSLEIFNDGFRASPNGATAKDGYRSLLWLEEQTRRRLPTCDADLFSPPPLPVYHGLEFIEFAASAAEAQRGATSAGAGFSARGSHRSRQVTLWRNGGRGSSSTISRTAGPTILSTPRGIALRDGAAGRAQRVACRPRPRAGVCHRAGRRRAERNADPAICAPTAALSISSTPGGYLRARFSSA